MTCTRDILFITKYRLCSVAFLCQLWSAKLGDNDIWFDLAYGFESPNKNSVFHPLSSQGSLSTHAVRRDSKDSRIKLDRKCVGPNPDEEPHTNLIEGTRFSSSCGITVNYEWQGKERTISKNTLKLRTKLTTKEDSWTIIIFFFLPRASNNISIESNDAVM